MLHFLKYLQILVLANSDVNAMICPNLREKLKGDINTQKDVLCLVKSWNLDLNSTE
jgi:hypothetical protein